MDISLEQKIKILQFQLVNARGNVRDALKRKIENLRGTETKEVLSPVRINRPALISFAFGRL